MRGMADERDEVARLKRGDTAAFETIVRKNAGWMLVVARRITNCNEDAADCVQESFALVLRKVNGFEERSSFKTWLHRIVVNQALMKLRKRRRVREESIDDLMPMFDSNGLLIGPVRMANETVEDLASKNDISAKVRQAINELPDSYRTILLLRDIEEMTTAETSEVLDVPEGTLRTRLHRARNALRKKLETMFKPLYLDDIL